ncbi:MAG: hypothetical protein OEX97_14210, partial [Acidimicrobiia bacterium]|nr:hypothetical protein [Acidimicrobiia bacterium]
MRRTIAVLLLLEGSGIAAVHNLGSLPGFHVRFEDLSTARVDDAVASALRYITLALCYWMLVSTVLYLAAQFGDLRKARRVVHWATLPIIRRTVDRALAVSLAVGTLVAPARAIAQTPPPPAEQTYIPTTAGFGQPEPPIVVVDDAVIIPPGVWIPPPTAPSQVAPAGAAGADTFTGLPTHLLFEQAEMTDEYGEYQVET